MPYPAPLRPLGAALVWSLAFSQSVACDTLRERPALKEEPSAPRGVESGAAAAPGLAPTASPSQPVQPPTQPVVAAPPTVPVSPDPGASLMTEDERNSVRVFEAVAPSTVFVTNRQVAMDPFAGPVEVPAGAGSGFIWDREGHVVTNFHVIAGAKALSVTLHDQRTFDATVVGVEDRKDIAVLQLVEGPKDLVPVVVQRGPKLKVGQKTLAIGNPFGLDQTLTTGIISALGRSVPGMAGITIRDMVQTDAAINPGNSGGPLLDSAGRLIGMNTMIYSKSGSSAGIGFAVPATTIGRLVPQIIRTGKAEQVGIGVRIDPNQGLERRWGITGMVVLQVPPGSPAERAGLKGLSKSRAGWALGDVIVGVADDTIRDYDDLYNAFDQHRAGEKVKLTVQRGKQRVVTEVELELLP
jgi:S1-C subfamily serine protease